MNLKTVEIKAFVPARDMDVSLAFYTALGFEVGFSSEALAYIRHGETSFLLQKFYLPEHANNFMMHMLVENVEDWYAKALASDITQKFGVRLGPPADRPWRIRDFVLTDPTGVLWRIGQNL